MAKILITWWAWFIGSHLADYLIEKWHNVVIIDNLSGWFERNLPLLAKFYLTDICNKQQIDNIFKNEQFDYVYHLAAYAAEWLSHFIRYYNYMDNMIGSINIINGCIKYKVKHLVFTSSMAVYGVNTVPFDENMIPQPVDPYWIAKYAVEMDLKCAKDMFWLNYTIFRPHNVVWTRQHIWDSYRNVVGIFINQIMQNKPMTVFWDGSQVRAFSYIEDMLPYFEQALYNEKANWEIYNIWWETPYTIKELTKKIQELLPLAKVINEEPRVEVHKAYSLHNKLYKDFWKLSTLTDIDEWLPIFIDWCKLVWPQPTTKFDWIEIEDKLPNKWRVLLS